MGEISCTNGNGVNGKSHPLTGYRKSCWYEEEIEENLRWSFALKRDKQSSGSNIFTEVKKLQSLGHEKARQDIRKILHTAATQYQDIALLDTKPFGKALVIDGKLQSAEVDEFIYHECLVHPPLLHHSNAKVIFIMGGGEDSTAREILRHKNVEKLIMCDIDEVVEFCKSYLAVNREAFCDPRMELIINDARAELENRKECYDVIIGDLADPIEGGPCYKHYTKSFYEFTVKPRLNHGGIFVTQAGPAGIFSHTEFADAVPYSAHIPSYADTWGWIVASDSLLFPSPEEVDQRMKQRIKGENRNLDGKTFLSASTLSKAVRNSLENETQIYTEGTARFIYGHGKHSQE